jgi:hypothetical protein
MRWRDLSMLTRTAAWAEWIAKENATRPNANARRRITGSPWALRRIRRQDAETLAGL